MLGLHMFTCHIRLMLFTKLSGNPWLPLAHLHAAIHTDTHDCLTISWSSLQREKTSLVPALILIVRREKAFYATCKQQNTSCKTSSLNTRLIYGQKNYHDIHDIQHNVGLIPQADYTQLS